MYYLKNIYEPYQSYGISSEKSFFECSLCHDNKSINCLECQKEDNINVQNSMVDISNSIINNGDFYILFNEPPRGNDGICKTT